MNYRVVIVFQPEFMKAVVGTVVLTEYNNSTYTIADVNWDESPRSQFERNGTKVTFIQYYKEASTLVGCFLNYTRT